MAIKEVFGNNMREIRQREGLLKKEMAKKLGISESTYREWEKGKADIRISTLEKVSQTFRLPPFAIVDHLFQEKPEKPEREKPYDFEMRIYSKEDRLAVIGILANNGYEVGQHKRQRTPTGKVLDYFVHAKLLDGNADTSK